MKFDKGVDEMKHWKMTDRQWWFLRKLLIEAFANRYAHGLCLDYNHHPDHMSKDAAGEAIQKLLNAKRLGWKLSA